MSRVLSVFTVTVALALGGMPAFAAGTGSDSPVFSRPSADDNYRDAVRAVKAERYRQAITLLNRVIAEKPRHPDALNYLGFSHRKLGEFGKAVSYYQRALSLDPDHRGANEYLGEAYVELGNLEAARDRLAHLQKICGKCREYEDLSAAIAAAARRAKQG